MVIGSKDPPRIAIFLPLEQPSSDSDRADAGATRAGGGGGLESRRVDRKKLISLALGNVLDDTLDSFQSCLWPSLIR